jgi:hypothetical protein
MKTFMVEVSLPHDPPSEFFSLIPSQRKVVVDLMTQRKILSYTLSADRRKVWIVLGSETEDEARSILSRQPMDKFFHYTFHELMFHETANVMFPAVSLN